MSASADISIDQRDGVLVAAVAGEVDMTNADYVREELTTVVPNDAHLLVMDLSRAQYLDSAAIEVLFELSRRLSRRRQQLRLVVPTASPLRRLLEVIDVGSVAPLHEDVDSAAKTDTD